MSDHIPFDLQVKIMKKLPVKSLIRFRSVSKSWNSVIDSSDFIAGYTVSSHDQPQHLLIRYETQSIRYTSPPSKEAYVSIVDDDSFPRNKFSLTVPSSVKLLSDSIVVGTSYGLVCLFGYYRNPDSFQYGSGTAMAVIWNPSIRKSIAIDVPDEDWPEGTTFGFGVCPATGDPKIVKINDTIAHLKIVKSDGSHPPRKLKGGTCGRHWQVEVYSLSSGVWRSSSGNLSDELDNIKWPHSQVIIDGFIYWIGVRCGFNLLISFDLSSEEFREVHLPDKLASYDFTHLFLFKISDSIALLQEWIMGGDIFEVWMMDNNDSKSFTKHFSIIGPYMLSRPLEFRRNGELMMTRTDDADSSEALIVFEHFSKRINDLGIKAEFNSLLVSSYTESLILLDSRSDTLVDDQRASTS